MSARRRSPAPVVMRPPDPRLASARALAHLFDEAIRIPGTKRRIGIDPFIGVIPGLGDIVGGASAAYLILVARRVGAPTSVMLRMLWNIAVDVILGAVPFVGDLFDAGWKANVRNLRLLERYVASPHTTRAASRLVLALILFAVILLVAGTALVTVLAIGLLVRLAT